MSDEEFENFLAQANDELRLKQNELKEQWHLGSYARWWYDQTIGTLQFLDAEDTLCLEAEIVIIGSYAEKSSTWRWAWANTSILPWLRQRSEKLRELEQFTGIGMFLEEHAFTVEDESMAWELSAMAVKYLGAIGCYRGPSSTGGASSFFAITAIHVRAAAPQPSVPPDVPASAASPLRPGRG